ncbi:MAG: hypothetical protein QXQ40_01710 [Candidatus Aenigmatarchaeota archaeon]
MEKGKIFWIAFALLFTLTSLVSIAQATNVALVVKNATNLNEEHEKPINKTLSLSGYNVTLIDSMVNFSGFDVIVVAGRQCFSSDNLGSFVADIPVNDYPTIAIDCKYILDWGWATSASSIFSSQRQRVYIFNEAHPISQGYSGMLTIHTIAGKPLIAIDKYKTNLKPIATSSDSGDYRVIAYAEPKTTLSNGNTTKARIVFFGVTYPLYWTDDAETLFLRAVEWAINDYDKDKVRDDIDLCPSTPIGEVVDENGCSCSQKTCNDGVGCTIDTCNTNTAHCIHTLNHSFCGDSKWYDADERWVSSAECKEKKEIKQEYRNYYCTLSGCAYDVIETRWIDTSNTRNKPDGTACDDGLYCTVNDACTSGTCGGVARDCSSFNLPKIETCDNNPDNNPFTWDYFPGFTSVCDESLDKCTIGTLNITHTCSKQRCNATCEVDSDCACPQDHCEGIDYYDYPNYGKCLANCSCDVRTECQSAPCKPTVYHNDPRCDKEPPVTVKTVGEPKVQGNNFTWITQGTKITLNCTDNFGNVTLYWAYKVENGDWQKFNSTGYAEFYFHEDSNHMLQYYCEDQVGNKEIVHEQYYKVDTEPPVTNKTYGIPFYSDSVKDYINSSTQITLSSSDRGCSGGVGLLRILYKIDNGQWRNYTNPFTISEEGEHRICFKALDLLGNQENEKCQNVTVDNTPPSTTKTIGNPKCTPETCNSTYWTVNSSTMFTLSATDNVSGLNKTYYRYCSGTSACTNNWIEYTAPFNVTGLADGLFRLEYYSKDNLGNKECEKYEIDYLDNTPPTTSIMTPFNVTRTVTNFTVNIMDQDHCLKKCYYAVCNETGCTDFVQRTCNSYLSLDLCNYLDCGFCEESPKNITIKAYAEDCIGYKGNTSTKKYIIDIVVYPEGYKPEYTILFEYYPTPLIPTFVEKWYYFFLSRTILEQAGVTNFSVENILKSIEGKYEIVFHYNGTDWTSYDPERPAELNTLKEFKDYGNGLYYIKMKE